MKISKYILSFPNKHSQYSMKFLIFRIDAEMLTRALGDMFNIFFC